MDENPKIPWLNVWMILVSVGGIRLAVEFFALRSGSAPVSMDAELTVLLLLLTGVIGVTLWPRPSRAGAIVGEVGETYLTAWRTLWRQKWILGAFGVVAAIRVIAALVDTPLIVLVAAHRQGSALPGLASIDHSWLLVLANSALFSLVTGANTVLAYFTPHAAFINHSLTLVLSALVILIGLIWVRKYLAMLSNDPEYARHAQFLRGFIAPAVVALLAVSIGAAWDYFRAMLVLLHDPSRTAIHAMYAGPRATTLPVLYTVAHVMLSAIVNGVLIAGIGVSLARLRHGEQVVREVFARDVVRYFAVVAGVYLVLGAAGMALELPYMLASLAHRTSAFAYLAMHTWPIISILFIFAPFIAVCRDVGAWQAIKESVLTWVRKPLHTLAFLAVGYSLLLIPQTMLSAGLDAVRGMMWVRVPYAVVYVVVTTLLAAFATVAVWEFYWRISVEQRSSE
jgi:hypothetical protein